MAEHRRIREPETAKDFARRLGTKGVTLPLACRAEQPGTLYDATGRAVLTVDLDSRWSDRTAFEVAGLIMIAVNKAAGFGAAIPAELADG